MMDVSLAHGYRARHILLDNRLCTEVGAFTRIRTYESEEFGIGEIETYGHDGSQKEISATVLKEREEVGPQGFPRGHRAPVSYFINSPIGRALAMQRP